MAGDGPADEVGGREAAGKQGHVHHGKVLPDCKRKKEGDRDSGTT